MRNKRSVIFKIIMCLLLVAAIVVGVTVATQRDTGAQTAPDSVQSTASPEPSVHVPEETETPDETPTAPAETTAPTQAPATTPVAIPTSTAQPAAETCTVSISCTTALQSAQLPDEVRAVLPGDGQILGTVTIELETGDTAWTVLQRVTRAYGIAMEAQWTPAYNSAYVQGIGHLYEFDCGQGSGWMYSVNGAFPNVGCSSYTLQAGDVIQWQYTCSYGHDIGG